MYLTRIAKNVSRRDGTVGQALARVVSLYFDRRYRSATDRDDATTNAGSANQNPIKYTPAGWLTLLRIIRTCEVAQKDVFLDLGSGKGRAVLIAAAHRRFQRVIGVEIAEDLHVAATQNISKNLDRLKCRNVELVHSDVLEYDIPDDVTVVFLFNPFKDEIFAAVLSNLLASIDARPRRIRLIYVNPVEEQQLLATGRATRIKARKPLLAQEYCVYELR